MNPAGVIMRVLIVLRSESHWQLIFLCETATLARCLAGDVSPRQVSFLSLILLFTMYWPTSSSYLGLPWWLSGKESPYERRRPRFEPWVRKISWRRKWQPTLAWRVSWTKELTLPAHWELWQMHGLWVSPDLISAASLQQSLFLPFKFFRKKKNFFFFISASDQRWWSFELAAVVSIPGSTSWGREVRGHAIEKMALLSLETGL